MLVEELIQQLQALDPKLPVVGNGYEGGYCDLKHVGLQKIALNVNSAWYYGAHEAADDYKVQENLDKYIVVDAVFIG